jgi:2-deoxy-D-gluconate 3-dehydrogenase
MPDVSDAMPLSKLHDLDGQVAVITGAGSGVGRAATLRLSEAGARVVCVDLDKDAANATGALVGGDGRLVAIVSGDVRDADDVARMVDEADRVWGRTDILVNSAGVFPPTPALSMTSAEWDHVLDINAKGTFLMAQACARHMQRHGRGGRIVNIASKSAFQPTAGLAHYAASKGAVVQLTKALALELSPLNIRVNAVAPGGVDTAGAARARDNLINSGAGRPEKTSGFAERCPMGRSASADEIARIVLFLSSDWSSYMTGTTVVADGGYLLT